MPHKFPTIGVFANDLSDHCVIGAVRDTRIPCTKPRFIQKRNLKHFNEQAFLHDVCRFRWDHISLFGDVDLAWEYFHDNFINFINKHAPIHGFRVKGRDSPWFTSELSNLLYQRNRLWAGSLDLRQIGSLFVN